MPNFVNAPSPRSPELPVVVSTAGDLWKALSEGKKPGVAVSSISIGPRPGPNIVQPTFPGVIDQTKWDTLERALALCDVEGGEPAEAMRKLIARAALAKGVNRHKIINMPLTEFVATIFDAINATTHSPGPAQSKEGIDMKDELPSRIWSVQDYYQAKEFYAKRGLVFNPALERGSPAAAHVVAQRQLRAVDDVNYDPSAKSISLSIDDVRGKVDFGIVTVRADEFQAVLSQLQGRQLVDGPKQKQIYQYARVSTVTRREVGVAVARTISQGQAAAESLTRDMIDELNPKWLLVVGIAGGIPAHEFSLGDVVLASRLHDFSVSAAIEGHFVEYDSAGGPMHQEVEKLLAAIPGLAERLVGWNTKESIGQAKPNVVVPATPGKELYGSHGWRKKVRDSLRHHFPAGATPRPPLYHVGPTASSNTLVKDTELAQKWLESARQISIIEMELAGVCAAARRAGTRDYRVLAIRGISDIVGYRRSPEWTAYACSTAASFALAITRSGLIQT